MMRACALALLCLLSAQPAIAQTNWGVASLGSDIFFCDPERNTVWKVDATGARTAALEATRCRTLVTGPDRAIYGESVPTELAATGLGLWRLSPEGERKWLLPSTNAPDPTMWIVGDANERRFAWTGEGESSIRSEIVVRNRDGVARVFVGAQRGHVDGVGTKAQLGNVGGMAIAPDGSLVFADSGNIRRASADGDVRTEALGVATNSKLGLMTRTGLWERELGVATNFDGDAVVVDPEQRRIISVDRRGHARAMWVSRGFGWRPSGVAVVGRTFYVLEERPLPGLLADLVGTPRLLHVDETGRVTRVLTVSNWLVRGAFGILMVIVVSGIFSTARRRRTTATGTPAAP
jgi:hypothetical protein